MKKKYWLLYFILVAAFVSACSDEQQPAKPGNVRFTINSTTDPGGRISASLPDGASLYVSIQEAGGGDVYTLEQVTLLKLGAEYISEPLALPPGDYNLTDFLIVNAADGVVYAIPKEGSDMADWVDDPLPMAFGVNDNAITGLSVQVVSTSAYPPAAFGYLTFQVSIVPGTAFRLAVFKPTGAGFVFTQAQAYILDGADTVHRQHLGAAPEAILLDGDLARTYTLVVIQSSYKKYTQTFVLGDLLASLAGAPLSVTLTPALTFTSVYHGDYDYSYQFGMDGDADLMIDWGDGVVEPKGTLEHIYEDGHVLHFVSIYGNLESITELSSYYGYGATTEISLVNLPNLRMFAAVETQSPAHLDFRYNPLIEVISLPYSDVRSFDLPEGARLSHVDVVGNDGFSESTLNAAIRAAYLGQIERGYTGYLYLSLIPGGGGGFPTAVTEESLAMLRELRDWYGWFIWPYEF